MTNLRRVIHLLLLLGVFTIAHEAISATASSSNPEAIVQAQVEAYNAHDIDTFVATYTEDAQLFEHPAKLLAAGSAQLRERYAARFKEPNLHAVIVKRIVMGNVVVDHERVTRTFPEGSGVIDAVAIYEVQNGKIAKAWLIFGPKALEAKP
jgi:hypothetical protein